MCLGRNPDTMTVDGDCSPPITDRIKQCTGFARQGFCSSGGYRGCLCEKMPRASPMLDRANQPAQDGPTRGQGQASHQWW